MSISQPGAVINGFIRTALGTANFGRRNATIVIALGGVLLSCLTMMLACPVKHEAAKEQAASVAAS